MVRFGVQGMQYFAEPVRTRPNRTLRCQNIIPVEYVNYHFWSIACDFVDQFQFRVSNLNGAVLDRIAYCQLTPIKVSASLVSKSTQMSRTMSGKEPWIGRETPESCRLLAGQSFRCQQGFSAKCVLKLGTGHLLWMYLISAYSLVHQTLMGQIYGYRPMCIVDLLFGLYSIQLGLRAFVIWYTFAEYEFP
jgi:hypothetical protein